METLRVDGPWTVADRDALPEDGKRYEIIDGVLFVNAAPRPAHQEVALMLWKLLYEAAPDSLAVYAAPLDVLLADDTVVEPDVLVAPRGAFTDKNLPVAPRLAVEVLSDSTRRVDLDVKKERYERSGVASYWVIDPDTLGFTAFELQDGGYTEVTHLGPRETWTATQPFAVTVDPATLRFS